MVLISIFRSVPALETLIIESSIYINGLFLEPHTFLSNSLKKLYIGAQKDDRDNLSARNGIWLLLFVPQISEAALWIDVSIDDIQFFLEFGDTVESLSRVSKISLGIKFVWIDANSKTWWGFHEELYRHSIQGNQKTFAVSQLLRCVNTNQLISLEINSNFQRSRKGDDTFLLAECLNALHHSFNSLLHLRLFGLSFRKDRPDSRCFSNFRIMKMLTLDDNVLHGLQIYGQGIVLPSSLEVVWLPYYTDKDFQAEDHLGQFIKLRSSSLPKLRDMVVPMAPVFAGKLAVDVEKENWTRKRERLEKEEIFTSGRVNLRKAEDGEMGE